LGIDLLEEILISKKSISRINCKKIHIFQVKPIEKFSYFRETSRRGCFRKEKIKKTAALSFFLGRKNAKSDILSTLLVTLIKRR